MTADLYPRTDRLTGYVHYVPIEQARGVYAIRNTQSGQVYIGVTLERIERRWSHHRRALEWGEHPHAALQADWRNDGADVFVFEVLEVVDDINLLRESEQRWIETYRAKGVLLYNHAGKSRYPDAIGLKAVWDHVLVCRVAAHRARRKPAAGEES